MSWMMRYTAMVGLVGLIVTLFLLSRGYGAEVSTEKVVRLNLSESIRLALSQSPEIQGAEQKVEVSEGKIDEAKSGFFPRMTFTNIAGVVPRARGDVVFSPDTTEDFNGLGPFTQGELEIVQPLYTFGKLSNSLLAAVMGAAAERAGQEKTTHEVIMQVKEFYYSLLLTRHIQESLGEVKRGFEEAVQQVEERLKAQKGKVTQLDLLKLKFGLAEATREFQDVEKNITITRAALQKAIGLPPTVDFDITDTSLEMEPFDLRPLDEYIELLFQHRPAWKQVEAGVASRKALLEAEKSNYYPTFFLGGGVQYGVAPNRDKQTNPFVNDQFNYLRGGFALGLRWDLNFLTTKAKIRQAEAELAKVQDDQENARLGLPLEVTSAYLDVKTAQENIEAALEGRKAGRGLLFLTLTNFKLGVGEAKDLFEALGIFARTTTSYYRAIHTLNLALARLSLAIGQEVTTLQY